MKQSSDDTGVGRQHKETEFLKRVRKTANEERANRLRWLAVYIDCCVYSSTFNSSMCIVVHYTCMCNSSVCNSI